MATPPRKTLSLSGVGFGGPLSSLSVILGPALFSHAAISKGKFPLPLSSLVVKRSHPGRRVVFLERDLVREYELVKDHLRSSWLGLAFSKNVNGLEWFWGIIWESS